MPFARNNKYRCDSEALSDEDGDAIESGTVEVEILSEDKSSTLIAKTAMSHVSAGVWRKDFTSTQINGIPAGTNNVCERITVGSSSPPDAEFELIVQVTPRRS